MQLAIFVPHNSGVNSETIACGHPFKRLAPIRTQDIKYIFTLCFVFIFLWGAVEGGDVSRGECCFTHVIFYLFTGMEDPQEPKIVLIELRSPPKKHTHSCEYYLPTSSLTEKGVLQTRQAFFIPLCLCCCCCCKATLPRDLDHRSPAAAPFSVLFCFEKPRGER